MTKRKFLLQGIALTAFSLFFRITNIGYRAYLSGKIGAEGMGLYQLIFSVFLLAITLSTSGISLAVTRMVTAAIAANHRCTVRSVVTQCFLFCLTVSCTIAVLLLCFSDFAAVESKLRAALESVHGTAMWNIPCRTPVACSFSFGVLRFKLRR